MKKYIILLLLLFSIVSIGLAEEAPTTKIGVVIDIVYHPAHKEVVEKKEWVGHSLVIKKVIEVNDDEYIVTVKYENGETENLYYDPDGFNIHIGDKIEVGDDFYD